MEYRCISIAIKGHSNISLTMLLLTIQVFSLKIMQHTLVRTISKKSILRIKQRVYSIMLIKTYSTCLLLAQADYLYKKNVGTDLQMQHSGT